MKKSDLVSGKHIVELEDGDKYLFLEGRFVNSRFWYDADAKINKIFEIQQACSLSDMLVFGKGLKLVWERKPELSEVERIILENVSKEYKWIAKDRTGKIYIYKEKPVISHGVWTCEINKTATMYQFGDLFKMIDSEAWEPTLIADLLGE